MYYKACLEVGKKEDKKDERVLYLQQKNIINAMDVAKKIRFGRLLFVLPINYDEYMRGIGLKYKD